MIERIRLAEAQARRADEQATKKVRGRPFQPGNPGRPPGAKTQMTRLVEQLLDDKAKTPARRDHRGSRVNAHTESAGTAGDAIQLAAAKLGDPARLAARAAASKENETVFWTRIFPRLLQLPDGMPNHTVIIQISETEAKF